MLPPAPFPPPLVITVSFACCLPCLSCLQLPILTLQPALQPSRSARTANVPQLLLSPQGEEAGGQVSKLLAWTGAMPTLWLCLPTRYLHECVANVCAVMHITCEHKAPSLTTADLSSCACSHVLADRHACHLHACFGSLTCVLRRCAEITCLLAFCAYVTYKLEVVARQSAADMHCPLLLFIALK